MSDTAIRVEGLSKLYRLGERRPYKLLRESLVSAVRRPFSARRSDDDSIWALKDVSFEVRRGEVVGVIGRNGAGKSTLLKILSRITEPTSGRAEVYGRVGSLLEVGTGFHPELTGRENIFLNGAVLGMRRAEITRRFDEIVAFAEVERFIDTPVKHYSSGMYLRLAFAVAAHLEPEILLIDEVLAVGDAEFQKKCLGRMGTVARAGRTVLFVSHDLGSIQSLTMSCLLFQGGKLTEFGATQRVIQNYLDTAVGTVREGFRDVTLYRRGPACDSPVRFTRLYTNRDVGVALPAIESGSDFSISMELHALRPVPGANVTLVIKNLWGQRVATLFSWDQGFSVDTSMEQTIVQLEVRGLPLAPGQYFVDVGVNQSAQAEAFDVLLDVPLFSVSDLPEAMRWPSRPWGAVHWRDVSWVSLRPEADLERADCGRP